MTRVLSVSPNPAKVGDDLEITGTGFGAEATLTTALTGTNNDLVYTAKAKGTDGNNITIAYVDPGGVSAVLGVVVVGSAITVNLGRASSAINTTAALLAAAIAASSPANALVAVANAPSNDGTGLVTALGATHLAGGTSESVDLQIVNLPGGVEVNDTVAASAATAALTDVNTYSISQAGEVHVKAFVAGVEVAHVDVEVFTLS